MDDYDQLLEAARRNPREADFLNLRLACTRSPQFNPYLNSVNTSAALRVAVQQDSTEKIAAAIQQVLANDYLDIEAHFTAHYFYLHSGKTSKADYHLQFGQGLLKSITTSDGRSYVTAFRVISIREEHAVMAALRLPVHSQRKGFHNNSQFDILTATHPLTSIDLDFYFNIDLMRTFFHRVASSHLTGQVVHE